MSELNVIPVNIWDDYYDDGYVPEGRVQETNIYIEEYEILTSVDKQKILSSILDHIKRFQLPEEVIFDLVTGGEIDVTNLTHKLRYELLKKLEAENMFYQGIPIVFYSES